MAALIMLMGLPGSGKRRLAKRLETERPALLLSAGDWLARIAADPSDSQCWRAVHALQLDVAEHVLRLGSDVVLESEFLHRADRDLARERAQSVGAESHLIFLDPPIDELARGLEVRHGELPPDTPPISRAELELCSARIERPSPDEPLWTFG